jgi:hypothetical protein
LSSIVVLGNILVENVAGPKDPAWVVGSASLKNVYSIFRSADGSFYSFPHSITPSLTQPCSRYETTVRGAVWTAVS